MRARHGYQMIWSGIHAAIFAPGATSPPGSSIAIRFRWRPACRACSRLVTCATTPSSEYRVAWARAVWPSPSSINTWLYSERTLPICCLRPSVQTDLLRKPLRNYVNHFRQLRGATQHGTMSNVRYQVDFGFGATLEDERISLWDEIVVCAVDDQHRSVFLLVEERTPRELLHCLHKFRSGRLFVEAHVVADDARHAKGQVLRVLFSPSLIDWTAEHDGGIDGARKPGHRRKVAAEGKSEMRDLSVAELARLIHDAEHELVTFDGKWDRTFTRPCNVEAQDRNAEALGQCNVDRVQTHFVGIDAARVNQHGRGRILACH